MAYKYTTLEKVTAYCFAEDLVSAGLKYYIRYAYYWSEDHDEIMAGREKFYENLKDLPYDTTIASGSTRGVFMRNDGRLDNWVLKVDFDKNNRNYCEMEAKYYDEAVKEGVAWAFAATYFLAEIDGIKFYLQERLDCDENCEATSSEILREYIIEEMGITQMENEDDDDYEARIADWIDDYIEWDDVLNCLIGDANVEEFVYQRDINDLHQANYGLTKNGSFKIVDYCGYYE